MIFPELELNHLLSQVNLIYMENTLKLLKHNLYKLPMKETQVFKLMEIFLTGKKMMN